ncbi:secretion protein HlyD [Sulfuricella denitrificans skB26]|uniref:Secretion protein HlyD n=1 Tax=Sulfuricella denitrificans (strain DSM 22764 / NBRC 105220 / skB26) TaxID=1163617 RepID=S6AJH4_SULDS|nr:efflux RND transporter periplasmic adaptor subunit [Sulfuricella denitrificans]BAN36496.1 secretion protein HlyD [Sulfuricella denitrificans skB26]
MLKTVWILLGIFLAPLAQAALPFAVATVEYREVDQTYAAEALVEAVKQSTVAAQISGRIVEVNFDVGETVKKGQVLVRIDESEVRQAVAGSEAVVAQARANLQNARQHYERTKQLLAQKFISQAALDKAQADYKAAEAQLAAAQASAGQATTTRGFTAVMAPYSGVVAVRHVELGEMASPGKALMTGFDPKDLRVVASVPQYRLAEVNSAARAQVEFPSFNKWITAKAMTILPTADARTHTTRVRLDLPEDIRNVYPGMFARAHFSIGRAKKLLVPAQAIIRRSEVTAVYVVDAKGGVTFRQIRLGEPVADSMIEVLAGLSAAETVALEPVKAGIYLKGKQ